MFESMFLPLYPTAGVDPFPTLKNAFYVVLSHVPKVLFQMSESTSLVDKLERQISSRFVLRGTTVKARTGRGAYPAPMRRGLVVHSKGQLVGVLYSSIGNTLCQTGQALKSTGLTEPERLVLDQVSSNVVLWAYDTDSPGPHGYDFRSHCTSEFLKAPDDCGDLRRHVKELTSTLVGTSFSIVDALPSGEAKFEGQRWFRHKSDDVDSNIRTTVTFAGLSPALTRGPSRRGRSECRNGSPTARRSSTRYLFRTFHIYGESHTDASVGSPSELDCVIVEGGVATIPV